MYRSFLSRILDNPKKFVALVMFIVLGLSAGLVHVVPEGDYLYFFEEDDPLRVQVETIQDKYSKNDSIYIGIRSKNGSMLDSSSLEALRYLTIQAWEIPLVRRVDSLSNFQHVRSEEDSIRITDLIPRDEVISERTSSRVKEVISKEPSLKYMYISEKAEMAAIILTVDMPSDDPFAAKKCMAKLRALLKDFDEKYNGDFDTYLSGGVAQTFAFNESTERDMATLAPLTYGLIFVSLAWFLGSFFAAALVMLMVVLSLMSSLGVGGWFGIPITAAMAAAPTIIMTIVVANCVHLMTSLFKKRKIIDDRKKSIIEGCNAIIKPVVLSGVTTIIGFLQLNHSTNAGYQDLGNLTSVGILVCFFLSMTLLPVLMNIFSVKLNVKPFLVSTSMFGGVAGFILNRKKMILGLFALILLLVVPQINKITLDDDLPKYMGKGVKFREDSDVVGKYLMGAYQIQYDIPADGPGGIYEPEFLRTIDKFVEWYRGHENVRNIITYVDMIKRANSSFNGDSPEFYSIPESRELAAQYTLAVEMSLPLGQDLSDVVSLDKSSTRLIVSLKDVTARTCLQVADDGNQWLKDNAPESMHVKAAGGPIMFGVLSKNNVKEMLMGAGVAIFLITGLLIISLKSIRLGLICLIPNILPSLVAMGLWGYFVGTAGIEISVVGLATFGIIIDDTVHFITTYITQKNKASSFLEAVSNTFSEVGGAIILTSLVLCIGFVALIFSSFRINYAMGVLSFMTILIALVVDLLLLPIILTYIDVDPQKTTS